MYFTIPIPAARLRSCPESRNLLLICPIFTYSPSGAVWLQHRREKINERLKTLQRLVPNGEQVSDRRSSRPCVAMDMFPTVLFFSFNYDVKSKFRRICRHCHVLTFRGLVDAGRHCDHAGRSHSLCQIFGVPTGGTITGFSCI